MRTAINDEPSKILVVFAILGVLICIGVCVCLPPCRWKTRLENWFDQIGPATGSEDL